jgi:hypothetical protein
VDAAPLIALGPAVAVGFAAVPPPLMVLQPNPLDVVHVRALDAALHDGMDCAEALAVEAVALPRTVFAAICAMLPRLMPLVRDWKL